MGPIMRGRRDRDVWVKAEGMGQKHGFDLKEELENRNAITLPDILEICGEKYGSSPCIGTRKLLERRRVEEGSKTLEKLVLGDYEWKTVLEVNEEVLKVAAALKHLGFYKGQRVAILAETRAEWMIAAMGCLKYGLTIVTLYSNLSDAGFIYGIKETEVDSVFTSFDLLPRMRKILTECPLVRNVIVFEDQLEGVGDSRDLSSRVNLMSFSTFITLGDGNEVRNLPKLQADDTAIIMYTSGSTGHPKGVEISHTNIFYSFIGYTIQCSLSSYGDTYLAYLPLAHVMELLTEIALISLGVTIAYSSPLTLTDSSPKIAAGSKGDAKAARPTILTAVPLILDRIIKSISQKLDKEGKLKQRLFHYALKLKQNYDNMFTNAILDAVIFNKVKAELGGNVRMMVVGGAPLSPQTHSKIRAMFGCIVHVGYGCTETTASVSSMDCDDTRIGHAGPPNAYVRVQLVDWEEGDYKITDKPRPRGEIVVGGPCVTKGYFKLPKETAEAFYEEEGIRWFRTGDIGEFDETGVLYIIDRKKDLVKLKNGEYISLGNIESTLKTHVLVDNICVVANPTEEYPVAIIVPSVDPYRKLAKENGIGDDPSFESLCRNKVGVKAFLDKMAAHGKANGLLKWEIPTAVYLTHCPWTPDNGLVTSAMKLKRIAIHKEFREQIKALYSR